jgi:hypothetical protein
MNLSGNLKRILYLIYSLTEIFKSLQLFQTYLAGSHKSAKAFANSSQIIPTLAMGHG